MSLNGKHTVKRDNNQNYVDKSFNIKQMKTFQHKLDTTKQQSCIGNVL